MRSARILICDDRELNRYLRAEILRKAGYEIVEALTGTEALNICDEQNIDLALLDVHLPDMSGLEVCDRIKRVKPTNSIMVVQISASAVEIRDAVMGLESGADDYLIEPVEPELLVAKVRSLLRLRSAEEDLRRSNSDLSQFAYVVSHDLQEPLRSVITSAQLMQRNYSAQLDEHAHKHLQTMVASSARMGHLIRDLLEYSHVASETGDVFEQVDLNAVMAEIQLWLSASLTEANGTLTVGDLPVLTGLRVRISQVLKNLVENGIKYRRPDVSLQISVSSEQRMSDWLIKVQDNGQGFNPESADRIFGVFRRLHGREVAGSGIGLAICKTIVERAGGRIWAIGTPGEGATFYFTWPLA